MTQIGLAAKHGVRPDAQALIERLRARVGLPTGKVIARRSGLIPAGATLPIAHKGRVMLVGDAAGHVSPLTGGGIAQTLRLGRRAAQLTADWLLVGAEHPGIALAREAPKFRGKLWLRRLLDLAPPNWMWNLCLSSVPFKSLAQSVYFHKRGQAGSVTDMRSDEPARRPANLTDGPVGD